jgi:hypothetical protein
MSETKKCLGCGEELLATLEFFHKYKDGLKPRCKKCRNKQAQQYRDNNRALVQKQDRTYYERNREIKQRKTANYRKDLKERGIIPVDYASLHKFIKRRKSKTKYCTICNEIKQLNLASIDHTYTRDPNDYIWLCGICHSLYDKIRGVNNGF